MPAGKRQQSNPWLYAAITFVFLFLLALVAAIIFYVQFEDQRTIAAEATEDLDRIAVSKEVRAVDTLVGKSLKGKSTLGTLLEYFNGVTYTILGGTVDDEISAQIKLETANAKIKEAVESASQYISVGPNSISEVGLVRIIEKLKAELDRTVQARGDLQVSFKKLQDLFNDSQAPVFDKEQALRELSEENRVRVENMSKEYNQLRVLVEQTSGERVTDLLAQLDTQEAKSNDLYQDMLKSQAELESVQARIASVQSKVDKMTKPDSEVAAYQADGKIILINEQAQIVHISIGSEQGVYRGLTFQVYDKTLPIPTDGKGKAEIEVFSVEKNVSVAKIKYADRRNPMLLNDVVANLIWDSEKPNVFVVAGEFDFDNNGSIDFNGPEKIAAQIAKWGGRTDSEVSIETDFVVIGERPRAMAKPTFEQQQVDPMAMQKYEDSIKEVERYQQIQKTAVGLSIPVFNLERFLYLIGYKSYVDKTGSF